MPWVFYDSFKEGERIRPPSVTPHVVSNISHVRPHPRREDMAAAAADTIVAEFTTDRVEAALQRAARHAAASEHLWEVERAREREAEIARNRRKPPRKLPYWV
jgi:hypothetical protein